MRPIIIRKRTKIMQRRPTSKILMEEMIMVLKLLGKQKSKYKIIIIKYLNEIQLKNNFSYRIV